MAEHFDVVIVGAGISGIGSAFHLQDNFDDKSYVILEGREAMGGTWDLFRYPGIRSDSDMHTMGFSFQPWTEAKAIADGPNIRQYVNDTAVQYKIDDNIRYRHKVVGASWSSETSTWTIKSRFGRKRPTFTCNFLLMCNGYYNYDNPYTPDFKGIKDYKGKVIHPQQWPEDLDYTGKKIAMIGSGATAVTLFPVLAETAESVTMIQRSPTYMVSRPAVNEFANSLRKWLPHMFAYQFTRMFNTFWQWYFFQMAKKFPEKVKQKLLDEIREIMQDDDYVAEHFTPKYDPWDQRLCLVPDADFFDAIKSGKGKMVTDTISHFNETGIVTDSGQQIEADIIISATGLNMEILQGIDFAVDGETISTADQIIYKGVMCSNMPNLVFTMGYSNASWTLKADLTSRYVCRLMKHMFKNGYSKVVPVAEGVEASVEGAMNLNSGYVQRALDKVPNQGADYPWQQKHNFFVDKFILSYGTLEGDGLQFSKSAETGS